MNLRAIGMQIQKTRESRGLTQEQLAEKVNISASHMSVIERGVKPPKLETFIEIANALEIDANTLLSEVMTVSYKIVSSQVSLKLAKLPPQQQKKILRVLDTLINETTEN